MKKIGIYTHPLISNYGGILQNYALQQVLIKQGFAPITIDRVPKFSELRLFLSKMKQFCLKHNKNKILFNKQIELIIADSQRFVDKNIHRIKLINPNNNDLLKAITKNDIDTLIVGSDQVWRQSIYNNANNAFLGFVPYESNIKKISYAASFASSEWFFDENDTILANKLIKSFKAISVREQSGIDLVNKYLNRESELVLDPTLLLDREDYLKLCSDEKKCNQNEIFTYILDKDNFKENVINIISKALGNNVFENQPKYSLANNVDIPFNVDEFKYPSIEGWLDSFEKASFIITDSFHGTVFSIIFNKPFLTIANSERGLARFETLLSIFGLQDRLIDEKSNNYLDILNKSIDYDFINDKIKSLKKHSIDFLLKNLT